MSNKNNSNKYKPTFYSNNMPNILDNPSMPIPTYMDSRFNNFIRAGQNAAIKDFSAGIADAALQFGRDSVSMVSALRKLYARALTNPAMRARVNTSFSDPLFADVTRAPKQEDFAIYENSLNNIMKDHDIGQKLVTDGQHWVNKNIAHTSPDKFSVPRITGSVTTSALPYMLAAGYTFPATVPKTLSFLAGGALDTIDFIVPQAADKYVNSERYAYIRQTQQKLIEQGKKLEDARSRIAIDKQKAVKLGDFNAFTEAHQNKKKNDEDIRNLKIKIGTLKDETNSLSDNRYF